MSGHILVATGTRREAAALTQPDFRVIPGGSDAAGLRARLQIEAQGARGIMSFGFAGALDSSLTLGDWVIGNRLAGTYETECDPVWAQALVVQIPGARMGAFYADGRLISNVAEKHALGATHGALAADMESHIAAQIAAERGLPFAIVRCISDEASHILPPAIAVVMQPGGGIDGWAMLRSVLSNPGQVPKLTSTIGGFIRAMAALKRGAALIRPD